jgi:ribulose-5-phosphate 4-epimerase/fuculose-1-phosphate aldolase
MFIHAAIHRMCRQPVVLHTHMPHATALTLHRRPRAGHHAVADAMRFHGRLAVDAHYNGLALDAAEGERIARAMGSADVVFLANHGVVVCGPQLAHAYDDLYYLERACQAQVLARAPAARWCRSTPALAARVAAQTQGERLQSSCSSRRCGARCRPRSAASSRRAPDQ